MRFKTSVGPLSWTFITGKGAPKYGKQYTSEDPLDFEYKASRVIDEKEAKEVQKLINDFWKENKPAKVVKPTSTFLKPEMVDSNKKDEYGAPIKVESGKYVITASTNAAFSTKDGIIPSKVAVLNKHGKPFPETHPLMLAEVGVADGSIGVIHGELKVTEYEGKAYVKMYLKGVQFAKFIPYELAGLEAEELDYEGDDGSEVEIDGCDVETVEEEKPAL